MGGTAALLGSATLQLSIHVDFSSFPVSRFPCFHKHIVHVSRFSSAFSLLFISFEVVFFWSGSLTFYVDAISAAAVETK